MGKELILKIENLNKSFGITHANRNISMELYKGEIRGLSGENGCGKSTLLSQIAGIYKSDSGTMELNGQPYKPENPVDANKHKIAIVVQELGLVGDLPGGVNIFLGRTGEFQTGGYVSIRKLYKAANDILEKWELPKINFSKLSSGFNVEGRKMIELVRALSVDPDILILDEVTQSLSQDNRNVVYKIIKKFKTMGRSVILISHDLEETLRITDSISIFRDGELLTTVDSDKITEDELKRKMVGRDIEGDYYRVDKEDIYGDEIVYEVKNVSTESGLEDVSFQLHKGEILAFCGLSDSGIHELGQVAYGLLPVKQGEVIYTAINEKIKNSEQALHNKVAYVPKDRDGEALMMKSSIMNNFMLPSINEIKQKFGYISAEQMRKISEDSKKVYNVKCTGILQNMNGLSGGNKQKVNLGRWLMKDLKILIVDCPTRGVDVGVKAYIYQCLKDVKEQGVSIILITDELSEAMGMADNIVVMKSGKIKKTIKRSSNFNEEEIIEVMI